MSLYENVRHKQQERPKEYLQRGPATKYVRSYYSVTMETASAAFFEQEELFEDDFGMTSIPSSSYMDTKSDEVNSQFFRVNGPGNVNVLDMNALVADAHAGLEKGKFWAFPEAWDGMASLNKIFARHGLKYNAAGQRFQKFTAPVSKPKVTYSLSLKLKRSIIDNFQRSLNKKFGVDISLPLGAGQPIDNSVRLLKTCGYTSLKGVFTTGSGSAPFIKGGGVSWIFDAIHIEVDYDSWLTHMVPEKEVRDLAHKELSAWWAAIKK